jgi:hypothetical protein
MTAKKKKSVGSSVKKTTVKVECGRFNGEVKKYSVPVGSNVQNLLDVAGISLNKGEEINNLSSQVIVPTSPVKDGETYLIVANYKDGIQ